MTPLLLWGCGSEAVPEPVKSPVPTPTIELSEPWRIAHRTDTAVVLRNGDGADGLRVDLGRRPGVSAIRSGRTLGDPMIEAPASLSAATIETDGPDLVVRLYGPPLATLREDAPDDPVHTWVRVRPRPGDWRVVVTGLATVRLPTGELGADGVLHNEWGDFALTLPQWHASAQDTTWTITTLPGLAQAEPYQRLAFTWVSP